MVALIPFKAGEHERQNRIPLLSYKTDNVLVVPQEERALGHLHMHNEISFSQHVCKFQHDTRTPAFQFKAHAWIPIVRHILSLESIENVSIAPAETNVANTEASAGTVSCEKHMAYLEVRAIQALG